MSLEPTTSQRVSVVEGDITRQEVDAIVNAANSALKRGGGVDGAIHDAAGPELQAALDRLGGCPTGEVRLTPGFRLPARWIIHTAGPVWRGGGSGEDGDLARCYRNALVLAEARGLGTLAFPAISTGIYGFPKDRAAAIAIASLLRALPATRITEVRLVAFDAETATLYRDLLGIAVIKPSENNG